MSDIVERLRAWAMDARLGKKLLGADQDLDEAATVIEAQRAESARLKEDLARTERNRDMWKGQVERQSATIARMREALTQARIYLKPFSAMPVGAPGSIARQQQDDSIAAFEVVLAALKVSP